MIEGSKWIWIALENSLTIVDVVVFRIPYNSSYVVNMFPLDKRLRQMATQVSTLIESLR